MISEFLPLGIPLFLGITVITVFRQYSCNFLCLLYAMIGGNLAQISVSI